MLKKWAVVNKQTGLVDKMFEEKALANYYITDCYGPEWDAVFIMETCEPLINVEFDGCDAFITYAEKEDGTPLTYEELDSIPSDIAYDYLMNYLY